MAQLVVRRLEEEIVRELRERAAKSHVSMEEEHRRILRAALLNRRERKTFKDHLLAIPAGDDDAFERRRTKSRRKLNL